MSAFGADLSSRSFKPAEPVPDSFPRHDASADGALAPKETKGFVDVNAAKELARRGDEDIRIVELPELLPTLRRQDAITLLKEGEHGILGRYLNEDSGLEFVVDSKTLSKTVNQPYKEGEPPGGHRVRIAAAYSLPEIIRKAISIQAVDALQNRGALAVYDLYSPLRWKRDLYRVRIKGVIERDKGPHARSLKVEEILVENAPAATEVTTGAEFPDAGASPARNTINIRTLFREINPYDANEQFRQKLREDLKSYESEARFRNVPFLRDLVRYSRQKALKAKSFSDWSRRMSSDLGGRVRPLLKEIWVHMQADGRPQKEKAQDSNKDAGLRIEIDKDSRRPPIRDQGGAPNDLR